MANFKVPDEGLIYSPVNFLAGIEFIRPPYDETLIWALYTNNYAIIGTSVYADIVEAAWAGYARYSAGRLTGLPAMLSPGTESDCDVAAPYPVFGNTSGAPQTAYGWFLTYAGGGPGTLLRAGGLFQNPVTIADGGSFTFRPPIISALSLY